MLNTIPHKDTQILELIQSKIVASLYPLWEVVKLILFKIERKLWLVPFTKNVVNAKYQKQLSEHAKSLPKLNVEDQFLLKTLQETGTCIIPIEDLNLDLTDAFLERGTYLINYLNTIPSRDRNFFDLEPKKSMEYPEIYLWGLEERLVKLVENYIGLPIYYQGCSMRRDIANGNSETIRHWHIDWEDRRVVKIIIYLNDVDINGGCYEYLPKQLTTYAVEKLNYDLGYISDETMAQFVPQSQWHSCTGKRGTVIISDVGSVFHRAKPPLNQDRFSFSFCYTSNKPKVTWKFNDVSQKQWQEMYNRLEEDKQNYLVNKNKLFTLEM